MNGEIVSTVGVGLIVVALMALAAARNVAVRPSARATALGFAAWTGASVAVLAGLPDGLFWGVLRPVVLVLMSLAVAAAPEASRTGREWLDLMLDGWMTVGGIFGLLWLLARSQQLAVHRAPIGPLMLWLVVQLAVTCLVGGQLARAEAGFRRPALVSFVVGVVVLAGDVLALVTGEPRLGIPFWLGSGLVIGVAMLVVGEQVYEDNFIAPEQPIRIRFWQLPVIFCLGYVFLPIRHDLVLDLTMGGLVGVLFLELVLHGERNEGLWRSLTERTRLYQDMFQYSQDVIVQIDEDGVIEFANPASTRVLSADPGELLGTVLRRHLHPDDEFPAQVEVRGSDRDQASSLRLVARVGVPSPVLHPEAIERQWRHVEWTISRRAAAGPSGEPGGWILSGRDVSERIALQGELVDAARTDLLTGLLNRGAFLVAVGARLAAGPAAVLFIDLDDFKNVNDTLGHGQGDEVLRRAAECLDQAVGPGDLVARLGGDEFAVLTAASDPGAARLVAEAVVTAFNGFDETALGRPSVSASIGIAVAETGTAIELLRDADLAMYRAKQHGGAGLVEFEPWMSERVMEQSRLRADLETAVRDEALTLHLQPVVDLHTKQWAGFEALVRWPVGRETWSPAQFLPAAEESGLIVPMGAWVLREALRQLAGWPDARLGMAVNVSALQLVGTDFFDVVMDALTAGGVAPDRLTLEITEQAAIQDLGRTASRLEALRSEGVHVAIDDFGTGFSSLQYLSRLPVDILKIDRKFVWGLGQQAEDDVLVRSMLGLAAELGLEVIAEGVETRKQADLLLEYGCRLAQGFLFSPPRPIEELRSRDPFVSPAPVIPRQRVVGPGLPAGTEMSRFAE